MGAGEFRYLNAANLPLFAAVFSPSFVLICLEFKWTHGVQQQRLGTGWKARLGIGLRLTCS